MLLKIIKKIKRLIEVKLQIDYIKAYPESNGRTLNLIYVGVRK